MSIPMSVITRHSLSTTQNFNTSFSAASLSPLLTIRSDHARLELIKARSKDWSEKREPFHVDVIQYSTKT